MSQISLGKVALTHGGDYNIATTYEAITLIRYDGSIYLSIQNNNVGHVPDETNSEWWKLIARDGNAPIVVPCTTANMTTYGIQSGVTLDEDGEAVVANDISNNIYRLIIVNAVGTASQTAKATSNLLYNISEIADAINTLATTKVNAESGKGLSKNDYTDEDKAVVTKVPAQINNLRESIGSAYETDITSSIEWQDGEASSTNLTLGEGNTETKSRRRCAKVDVSDCDFIKIGNLYNMASASTTSNKKWSVAFWAEDSQEQLSFITGFQIKAEEIHAIKQIRIARYVDVSLYVKVYCVFNQYKEGWYESQNDGYTYDGTVVLKKNATYATSADVKELQLNIVDVRDDVMQDDTVDWFDDYLYRSNDSSLSEWVSFKDAIHKVSHSSFIEITNYDYVHLSGLKRMAQIATSSNVTRSILLFSGNEQQKSFIEGIDADSTNASEKICISLADYKKYQRVFMVVHRSTELDANIVGVRYNERNVLPARRIILVGDSLTGAGNFRKQLDSIARANGWGGVLARAKGGENIIGNLTRAGGMPIRVNTEFQIPTAGSVNIDITSAWINSEGNYVTDTYNGMSETHYVAIKGVKCILSYVSETYVLTPVEYPLAPIKVGVGCTFYDGAIEEDKDLVHIWFTGQNGGWENDGEVWADMIDMAAKNFNDKYIVCTVHRQSGVPDDTTPAQKRALLSKFGKRYLCLSDYTAGDAIYDGIRLGVLTDNTLTASDAEDTFYPSSDKIHQNKYLSYIWAAHIWNKMLELGFVDGNPVTTDDYFIDE